MAGENSQVQVSVLPLAGYRRRLPSNTKAAAESGKKKKEKRKRIGRGRWNEFPKAGSLSLYPAILSIPDLLEASTVKGLTRDRD